MSEDGDERSPVSHRDAALGDYATVVGDRPGYEYWDDPATSRGPMVWASGDCIPDVYPPPADFRRQGAVRYHFDFSRITDGLSNTIFIGEKHVPPEGLGLDAFFDTSVYNSDNLQVCGRVAGQSNGLALRPEEPYNFNFGSYHVGVCQFVYGDGSVNALNVTIDAGVLGDLANRDDGHIIPGNVLP